MARALRGIEAADVLPDVTDTRALIPPTLPAFVRRTVAPRPNLWIWYTVDGERVVIQAVTDHPPTPVA